MPTSKSDSKEHGQKKASGGEKKSEKSGEIEKYWKAVKLDEHDFTAWMHLLQHVEQQNRIEQIREAYDQFFKHFPYCYGYWMKCADLEKKHGNLARAQQVFERGLKAVPLSVDLWLHFITFYRQEFSRSKGSDEKIKSIYERSLMAAGTDFRSDKLWEEYITWETSRENWRGVLAIYDRLLRIPTQLFSTNFDRLKELIQDHSPQELLTSEELLQVRRDVRQSGRVGSDGKDGNGEGAEEQEETQKELVDPPDKAEIEDIRERMIETRNVVYRLTEEEISRRWDFEQAIRRPYFHVKPLERAQLRNWRDYLDFEMEHGSHQRTMVLFERCLIACALYESFWLKYAKYMERFSVEAVRNIYRRACMVHLPAKQHVHLAWAAFEEREGNPTLARELLTNLEARVPGLAFVAMRRVALERRQGNTTEAESLLTHYIEAANVRAVALLKEVEDEKNEGSKAAAQVKVKECLRLSTFYTVKLARFIYKVRGDFLRARDVLYEGLEREPDSARLMLAQLELEMNDTSASLVTQERNVVRTCDTVSQNEKIPLALRVLMAQRKLQFLEDFGSGVESVEKAYEQLQTLTEESLKSNKKKRVKDDIRKEDGLKRSRSTPLESLSLEIGGYSYYGFLGRFTGSEK